MVSIVRKLKRALLNRDPSFCDMYEDAHARSAAAEYLAHIRRHLNEHFGNQRLAILDAGCQAGRLLIPLAEDGHRMTGIDTSRFALRRAAQHASTQKVSVRLARRNIQHLDRMVRPESFDAAVCAEVLYLSRDYRQLLKRLVDSVRPGGFLFVSHRPTINYVVTALCNGRPDQAVSMVNRTEGPSPDGAYHNWQTPDEIVRLYHELHLNVLNCYTLDIATVRLDISTMHDISVKALLATARHDGSLYRIPRYVLAVAHKPGPA